MLLAHRLWEEVEPKGTATLEDWERAHAAALAELQPEFEAQWRGLDTSEQKTLRAIIAGEGSPYRAAVLERLGADQAERAEGAAAAERTRGDRGRRAQAGDRRPALRRVDRRLGLGERPLEPVEPGAQDSGWPSEWP